MSMWKFRWFVESEKCVARLFESSNSVVLLYDWFRFQSSCWNACFVACVLRLRLCVLRLVNDTLTCWASSVKRLLDVWQKRSTCMAKETYMYGKRDLHVWFSPVNMLGLVSHSNRQWNAIFASSSETLNCCASSAKLVAPHQWSTCCASVLIVNPTIAEFWYADKVLERISRFCATVSANGCGVLVAPRQCNARFAAPCQCFVMHECGVLYVNQSCHIQTSHVAREWVLSRVNESRNARFVAPCQCFVMHGRVMFWAGITPRAPTNHCKREG